MWPWYLYDLSSCFTSLLSSAGVSAGSCALQPFHAVTQRRLLHNPTSCDTLGLSVSLTVQVNIDLFSLPILIDYLSYWRRASLLTRDYVAVIYSALWARGRESSSRSVIYINSVTSCSDGLSSLRLRSFIQPVSRVSIQRRWSTYRMHSSRLQDALASWSRIQSHIWRSSGSVKLSTNGWR